VTTATQSKYHELRRKHPLMPAQHMLRWARTPDRSEEWEAGHHDGTWTRECEGFNIVLHVETESIFPQDGDYGHYVDEMSHWQDYRPEWDGNYPPPAEDFPLGLPYTSFRYSGPGWVQGEGRGYFCPEGIQSWFDYLRTDRGCSKSVAWDLTKEWVEENVSDYFQGPLVYAYVSIKVFKHDIELGSAGMGTSYIDNEEGRDYIFAMVDDYDIIGDAMQEAHENIEKLTEEDKS